MPKTPSGGHVKRNLICAFYRWEFIRRSELYARDFDEFFAEFGEWLESNQFDMAQVPRADVRYWSGFERGLDLEGTKYFQDRVFSYQACFMLKWGVIYPLHPSYTYDPNDLTKAMVSGIPANIPFEDAIDLSIPLRALAQTSMEMCRAKMGNRTDELIEKMGDRGPYEISVHLPDLVSNLGKHELFSINEKQWRQFKKSFAEYMALIRQQG